MSVNEIAAAVATIREYTRIKEEAEVIISAAQDAIKAHLTEQGAEDITGTNYKITWHTVNATKLDQTKLKADHPEIIAAYTIPNPYKRFILK